MFQFSGRTQYSMGVTWQIVWQYLAVYLTVGRDGKADWG